MFTTNLFTTYLSQKSLSLLTALKRTTQLYKIMAKWLCYTGRYALYNKKKKKDRRVLVAIIPSCKSLDRKRVTLTSLLPIPPTNTLFLEQDTPKRSSM